MMQRRQFMQWGAAASMATLSLPTSHAMPFGFSNAIDAHVHVWTPDVKRYPISTSFQVSDMQPASFTPEELFAHSRPENVARVVLIQMSFYQFDNRYMLDCMAAHPGVFGGVAIVDELHPNVTATMRSLADKGVRGFRLYSDKAKVSQWKNSQAMNAMWSYAADQGLAMCLLSNPDALPLINEMCQKHPKTRVVIDHFSRIGVSGSVDKNDLQELCKLADLPNTFVKTSAFYALGKKAAPYTDLIEMIQQVKKAFGANRLMWASDCPYQVEKGHRYSDSISLIRDRDFLTQEEKEWMLKKTAETVFFS